MSDIRIEKLSNMMVNYSIGVQPGQKVVIQGSSLTGPLLKAIYLETIKAGGHPLILAFHPGLERVILIQGVKTIRLSIGI